MKKSDRQTDSVSVVLFMRSTGSVFLADSARWGWRVYMTRAVNNRKLVSVEFTSVNRRS